jgi:2-polyprenyl-3-methyl-5-hydroxy-6-metoxy-1,4-benzoquinol methylase
LSQIDILSKPIETGFPDEWYGLGLETHFWFLWRLHAFLKLLAQNSVPVNTPLKVLEIGCGAGALRAQIESVTGWTVDGADINGPALKTCPAGRGRTLLYNVEDENETMVRGYDGVLLFDVLEHIRQPRPFLRSALRHVKPGGWLALNVPASEALRSRYDEVVGHHRRYSTETLAEELSDEAGAQCQDVRYWGLSLVPLGLARKLILQWVTDDTEVVRVGFKPPGKFINALLCMVMRAETGLLSRPPFGTSLLALIRVPN